MVFFALSLRVTPVSNENLRTFEETQFSERRGFELYTMVAAVNSPAGFDTMDDASDRQRPPRLAGGGTVAWVCRSNGYSLRRNRSARITRLQCLRPRSNPDC